jgi:hypothetical protein
MITELQQNEFSIEDYMQTADLNCRQERVLNWWLDSNALKVVALGKDDFLFIEYEPTEGGLSIESKLYTGEQTLQILEKNYAIDIKRPEVKLFFTNSIE